MKKILFVATAATLLAAGCQKTEVINPVSPTGEPAMSFSTGMSKLTKAPDAENGGELNLQEQNFKVWAFCAYEDAINSVEYGNVYDGISAIDVTYNKEGEMAGKWTTGTEYYWPGTAKSLDFFAVSTSNTWEVKDGATVTTEGHSAVITNPGIQTIGADVRSLTLNNYVVDNTDPNDDLMVAEFVRQDQSMNDKNVKLHFKHALAKVQFKFLTNATATDVVSVNSLKVTGLKTTGNLTVTETAENYGTDDNTGRVKVALAWTPDDAVTAEFTDDNGGSLQLTGEAQEYATWLVLPQNISAKTVEINYTINSRTFDQTFALTRGEDTTTDNEDDFVEWGINQVITYTVNLSPNKITFTPSVEDWAAETPQTDVN